MKSGVTALISGGLAFFLVLAGPVFAMPAAMAADRDLAAEAWVQDLANEATAVLGDPATDADDIAAEFQGLLVEHAAMRNFGRSALGAYSRTISDSDFDRFVALLEQYGTSVVQSRFSEYSGQSILVTGSAVDVRTNFAYVSVDSDVLNVHGNVQASVRWLLIRRGAEYRVYDLTVETTDETATFSLLQTQREEFNSVLTSNGGRFEALFDYLRAHISEAGLDPAN